MKKLTVAFSLCLVAVLSCKKKGADTPVTIVPERLELTPATSTVASGSTTTFSAVFYNNQGVAAPVPANVVWSSADNNIATVNQQGVVSGVAAGQTSIRITYNAVSASALITVTATTVPERLVIAAPTNSITVGGTTTFTLTYFNNQGAQVALPPGIIWSSENAALATVNQQGLVTGVATGQTNIKATLNATVASAAITVTNPNVPERLVISPGTVSVMVGNTAAFNLTYFNNQGTQAPVPNGVVWSTTNNTIATVSQQGLITGVAAGQTSVTATLGSINTTATVTVTANTQLATVTLTPASLLEINLNQTSAVTATGKNSNGDIITGLVFTWSSTNNSLVTVNNGTVNGIAYGTANINAASAGIMSPPLMVQVIRSGTFNGAFSSTGQAKLKIENGVLKLETSANFSVSSAAPDLRIYLSASTSNITNAVEVATLNIRSGMQIWNVPATNSTGQPVNITTYPFVMVWCKQFGGNYGHVVLP
jgi:uncharacterized protein YjdB